VDQLYGPDMTLDKFLQRCNANNKQGDKLSVSKIEVNINLGNTYVIQVLFQKINHLAIETQIF
jgi:hypothetical protein